MFQYVLSWTGGENAITDLIASDIAEAIATGKPDVFNKIKKRIETAKRIALWSTGKFFRVGIRNSFNRLEAHRMHPLTGLSFTDQTKSNRPKIGSKKVRTARTKNNVGGRFRRMIFAHVDPANTDLQVGILSGGANLSKKYVISDKWRANFKAFQQGGNVSFPGTSRQQRAYLRAIYLPIKKTTILTRPERQIIKPFAESNPVQDVFEKKFLEKMTKKVQL